MLYQHFSLESNEIEKLEVFEPGTVQKMRKEVDGIVMIDYLSRRGKWFPELGLNENASNVDSFFHINRFPINQLI